MIQIYNNQLQNIAPIIQGHMPSFKSYHSTMYRHRNAVQPPVPQNFFGFQVAGKINSACFVHPVHPVRTFSEFQASGLAIRRKFFSGLPIWRLENSKKVRTGCTGHFIEWNFSWNSPRTETLIRVFRYAILSNTKWTQFFGVRPTLCRPEWKSAACTRILFGRSFFQALWR